MYNDNLFPCILYLYVFLVIVFTDFTKWLLSDLLFVAPVQYCDRMDQSYNRVILINIFVSPGLSAHTCPYWKQMNFKSFKNYAYYNTLSAYSRIKLLENNIFFVF